MGSPGSLTKLSLQPVLFRSVISLSLSLSPSGVFRLPARFIITGHLLPLAPSTFNQHGLFKRANPSKVFFCHRLNAASVINNQYKLFDVMATEDCIGEDGGRRLATLSVSGETGRRVTASARRREDPSVIRSRQVFGLPGASWGPRGEKPRGTERG